MNIIDQPRSLYYYYYDFSTTNKLDLVIVSPR